MCFDHKNKQTMKKLYLIICFLGATTLSVAQSWQWAKQGGGDDALCESHNEEVNHIATDSQGNVYLASRVSKTNLEVDGNQVQPLYGTETCTSNIMLASFDCAGNYRWSKVMGGSSMNNPTGLAVDSQDNVYLIGYFETDQVNPIYFDSDLTWGAPSDTPPSNLQNSFIVKYSQAGVFQWVRSPESGIGPITLPFENQGRVLAIDVDNNGNLLILTLLRPGVFCGGAYTNNTQGRSFHLLRYDTNGSFLSGKKLDIYSEYLDFDQMRGKYNPYNNSYLISGNYVNIQFPTILMLGGHNISNAAWLGCFDSEGQYLWHHEVMNSDVVGAVDVTTDPIEGGVYLSLRLKMASALDPEDGEGSFAGITYPNPFTNEIVTYPKGVIKMTAEGVGVWGSSSTLGNITGYNKIVVSGNEITLAYPDHVAKWGSFFVGSAMATLGFAPMLVRLDKNTGVCLNVDRLSSPYVWAYSNSITADPLGNYYIGGSFQETLTVGSSTLLDNTVYRDFFIAKYGTNNCNCQVPTCSFLPYNNAAQNNSVLLDYVGQDVFDSVVWDFGDGSPVSSVVNPIHTYDTAGAYNVCVTATNSCDSYSYCGVVNTIALGNSTIDKSEVITLKSYPNPVVDMLTITQLQNLGLMDSKAYVMDLSGRVLFEAPLAAVGSADATLDMTMLSSGTYIVSVVPNNSSLIKPKAFKVIKK